MGLITLDDTKIIDELINNMSPVKINKLSNMELSYNERDIYRANYLGKMLKDSRII